MDYKKELEHIEKVINERKLDKARAEERIKTLEQEIIKLETELKSNGIEDITKIDEWIYTTKEEIEQQFAEAKKVLGE